VNSQLSSGLERFAALDSEVFVNEAVAGVGKEPIAAVGPGPGGNSHVAAGALAGLATRRVA
jgi:hypothetical protein